MGCDPSTGQIHTLNDKFNIIMHTISFGSSLSGGALYSESICTIDGFSVSFTSNSGKLYTCGLSKPSSVLKCQLKCPH